MTTTVKASNLPLFQWLADGAVIVELTFGAKWVYAVVLKNGRFTRRRYRLDQQVKVEQ